MSHKNGRENIGSDLPSVDTLYKKKNSVGGRHKIFSETTITQHHSLFSQRESKCNLRHHWPVSISSHKAWFCNSCFPSNSQTTCWRKYHTMKFIMLSFNTTLTHIRSEPGENSSSPPPESVGLCMWGPLLSPSTKVV